MERFGRLARGLPRMANFHTRKILPGRLFRKSAEGASTMSQRGDLRTGDWGDRAETQDCLRIWCRRGDSNPHGLPHTPLKRARLPIPPLRRQRRVSMPGRLRSCQSAAGPGSICFARSTQPSPRGRAAQLELPRCERAGNPQRTFYSALVSWLRPSARTPTYASGCRPVHKLTHSQRPRGYRPRRMMRATPDWRSRGSRASRIPSPTRL
jgi:hypothetical protein